MFEEFATLNELHDEVYAVRLLKNVVHSDDKGVINLVEDEFLDLKWFYRLMLDNDIFSNTFHGIVFIGNFTPNEENFAKSASTNNTDQLKIVPSYLGDSCTPVQ